MHKSTLPILALIAGGAITWVLLEYWILPKRTKDNRKLKETGNQPIRFNQWDISDFDDPD